MDLKHLDFDRPSDISVEIFNSCEGSCTGCMLSTSERRDKSLVIRPDEFRLLADELVNYTKTAGLTEKFRPVFSFGDVPLLDVDLQKQFYDACKDAGLPFSLTVTLASEGVESQYADSIALLKQYEHVLVDLTFDPFRFRSQKGYGDRIRALLAEKTLGRHVQVLLSDAILSKISPEDLAKMCSDIEEIPQVSLGFTPTQANLLRAQYRFEIGEAIVFAQRFYEASPVLKAHHAKEMERFKGMSGSFSGFVGHHFHIGKNLGVYPVSFTPYGDLILFERNGFHLLGSLHDAPLGNILNSPIVKRLSVINAAALSASRHDCENCSWFDACNYGGVGLARRLFDHHESKIGPCYGPADLEGRGR